MYEDAS
jgi:hypothetical protein